MRQPSSHFHRRRADRYFKPVAGTDSCQAHHVGTVASGQLHVRHDDGTEVQVGPGDAYVWSY